MTPRTWPTVLAWACATSVWMTVPAPQARTAAMNVCSFFMVVPFLETGVRGGRRIRRHGEVNYLVRGRREGVAELVLEDSRALQRERVVARRPVHGRRGSVRRIELELLVRTSADRAEVRCNERDARRERRRDRVNNQNEQNKNKHLVERQQDAAGRRGDRLRRVVLRSDSHQRDRYRRRANQQIVQRA